MAARKFLLAFALALSAAPSFGCASIVDDGDEEEDAEDEPVAETDDELRSAVSCRERSDTAYRGGSPYGVKVIHVGGKPVVKATGHAFLKMQAAADRAGVRLTVTSGFRTMEEQRRLYNCYKTRSCNGGNLAAKPGYSNHQNGVALDLSTSPWLRANASRFGFERTVSREPWHYEFRGRDPGGPCSRGAEAADVEPSDDPDETPATQDGLAWVSPAQDATVHNGGGVRSKARAATIIKVAYSQGTLTFGTSTDRAHDFGLDYRFKHMGDKTLTARGYDASGRLVAVDHVDFTLVP